MYKIVVSLFLPLFLATSCDLFQKDPEPIDFATVDEYPFFDSCDSLAAPELKKMCFEQTLIEYIQQDLDTCQFMNQTYLRSAGLIIHVDIHKDGHCSVNEIENMNSVEEALPQLQTQIISTVDNLPKVKPAVKKGQLVTSRFMIPLYIEMNK